MKKCLIKGALALSLGVVFISCSDKDIEFQSIADSKVQSFDENFRATYGTIASGHDWGFGSSTTARTRAYVDVNGNMWEEKPSVSPSEKTKVMEYVNMTRAEMTSVGHKYQENFPENLKNYWVTHVWTGTDTYTDGDNNSVGTGSSKMNHLQIGETTSATINDSGELSSTGWYHVNNFNRGNNTDWSGNTLVYDSGTLDFAYHNSYDSRYHNRWITVKGEDIDESLAGYYYVCFDFEGTLNGAVTKCRLDFQYTHTTEAGHSQTDNVSVEITLSGQYTTADQIKAALGNKYTYNGVECDITNATIRDIQTVNANMIVAPNDVYTDWIIRLCAAQPTEGSSGGDSSSSTTTYNDEVVTEYHKQTTVTQGRIFCEDLGATTDSKNNRRDIDYNDVVFDAYLINEVYYTKTITTKTTLVDGVSQGEPEITTTTNTTSTNNYTKIVLQAAGGTIPLSVAGEEVHNKFGVDVDVMVNTVNDGQEIVGRSVNGVAPVEFTTLYYSSLREIPIAVRWSNDVIYLTAHEGESPQKICVPIGTTWSKERSSIDYSYPDFKEWVNKNVSLPWYNSNSEYLYNKAPSTTEMKSSSDVILRTESSSGSQSSTTYTVNPSASEKSIWDDLSGSTVFPSEWSNGNTSIIKDYDQLAVNDNNSKAFGVGSKIRVYIHTQNQYWGMKLCWRDTDNNWAWSTLMEASASQNASHMSGNDGYIEYTVTETSLAQLQKAGIVVQGGNLIPLMITIDNTDSNAGQ